ncbi:hypothetical protein ACJJTC_004117 [Scirpophaga incertulas]
MHRLITARNAYQTSLHGFAVPVNKSTKVTRLPEIQCSYCRNLLLGQCDSDFVLSSRHQSTKTALLKTQRKKSKYKTHKQYGELLEVGEKVMTESKISISKLKPMQLSKLASSPISLGQLHQLTEKSTKQSSSKNIKVDPELLQTVKQKILKQSKIPLTSDQTVLDDDNCVLLFTNHQISAFEDKLNTNQFVNLVKESYYKFRRATIYDQRLKDLRYAINEGLVQEFDPEIGDSSSQVKLDLQHIPKSPHAVFREMFIDNQLACEDPEILDHLSTIQPQDLSHPAFEDMYDDPCLHSEIIEHEGGDQACNAITPKADEAISIKIKKLKEEIKQKKKNQREKRRALKEQNMKVDIKEMEQHSKQDALHVLLATHLQLLCSLNMIEEGRQVLQYYRHKSKIGVNHLKVTDVKVHNILMHGYAAMGQFENTKELLSFMAEGEIKPNAQTYAAVFECVERSNIGDKVTILKFYQKQLEERGLTLNDLFDKTEFLRDQRQVVLNAVRRLDPVFQPQYTPIPLDYDCPLMGRLHLDAVLERQGLLCSPAEGIISVEDMVQRGKEQLKIEMKGDVEMQNIDIKDEATSPLVQFCRQKLKEAETEWRSVIREAFLRNLSALKSQSKASHSAITLFPYLNSLNVEQFVELIMSEISKLVDGSETYSPTLKNLQRALGTQVYYKYQVEQYKSNGIIKKIEEIYEKYCEWYITRHSVDGSGVPYNPRQAWQALVNCYRDGASLDIAETQWPLEIRQNVGKFLYNIIINDVKIDVNMFKTKAKQKMLPAVYKVHRPLGRLVRMELKPHPVLARAWASACPPRLRMRTALLPTIAPPAPWSAPHPVAHLTPPAPLIRCVRTWAGRARRAAAHHRAARALVRAAPRRAPHPARAAHQVRTYVGRTCPPRCCPPPRRPRPGPRRTPSRTSPRPRRSSGAYVRGPDVPAALLPTTAPPAPWSAPHPVAHLTPPAPLIRCVRTWAGRARRAAAHHRAARALVRAAPRRAPHPARAAHQVRTYVGRTCPPRCCPPPRRPRPGPRRTPSRTSPRPRRSSGAYVRGPDVPAALLPTTAPHPVAHLTPPAPLIRCVRTWAGRARRAAAHHRAARALVRAAPRRAPHPARAAHQVRTYVGRTCPPRCCPPPRRPRPGPRRTPSRTSPRPRRSSGAYVRGPDVPAALLPTTAPPAPWSAPHPVAHLTPPAPLIRCVRTWAGRARRAAAHHRAARALVRAAPRRAPHPARAAHQVRTYVGRTCPPRCCPPPRRPRPGPRRTPSRTSPRPRRSSGAYVRGPDVPAPLLPTTAPPAPWSAPHPVAHLTPPAPLIRLAYHVNTQMKRIADAPPTTMYPVYDSLNQLGEVPWVINKPILDLQLKIFRSGGNKKLDIPPPSSALDTSQYGAATEPAAVFKRRVAISRARADMHSLWCDALYKLSLANHFRLKHAEKIMDLILDSADRPLDGKGWWKKSEEPWQTLACCMEIANAVRSPNPEEYMCGFPVHQDGSCNGLQHYAALGGDAAGAAAVNLAPARRPQDVYSAVVALVEEMRARDAANGVPAAIILENFVRRKVIKQTVMTTVYGVTKFGARLQIAKQLKDIDDFPKEHVWTCSQYLTMKTFDSLQEMFTSTKLIQDWFTECAKLVSGVCGESVEWVTPLGLPVVQPYYRRVASASNKLPLDQQQRPCTMKQRNAFPPNFIHSLDSSHMMQTGLRCQAAGLTFVSVHDCFWTHPADVPRMNQVRAAHEPGTCRA